MRARLGGALIRHPKRFSLFATQRFSARLLSTSPVTPTWPNIIFAEKHSDPMTIKILNRLLPIFEHLKFPYKIFHDEAPTRSTLDSAIAWEEEQIITCNLIERELHKNPLLSQSMRKKAEELLLHYQATSPLWKSFFLALKARGICYKGIDSFSYLTHVPVIRDLSTLVVIRDLDMMRNCFAESEPFFARIGLGHVKGMQRNIKRKIVLFGPEMARHQFQFFYIYSDKSSLELEKRVREGREYFPFDLTVLDGTKLTEDEIVRTICTKIFKAKNKLEQLNKDNAEEKTTFTFKK